MRTNYWSWDKTFMKIAEVVSQRSKDPCTQVGACIVGQDNIILAIGYNGLPRGCSDEEFPWGKESHSSSENKYAYVVHAEINAILNKNSATLQNAKLYVTYFPCNECAKLIIQAGIREIIYKNDYNPESEGHKAAVRMFAAAALSVRKIDEQ
jgi:dCMP deaminase